MSFYLTLPSNSSMNTFQNNTQSNYNTLLPKTIELNDKYEVGLAEISYTNSFSINIGSITITQDIHHENDFKDKFGTQKINLMIDDCLTFQQFIIIINNEITKLFFEFYKNNTKKDTLKEFDKDREFYMPSLIHVANPFLFFMFKSPTNTKTIFEGPIVELLKLSNNVFESTEEKIDTNFSKKFFEPVIHLCDNFLIYTDIITDQLYGDVSAKILRNVNPSGTHGDRVSITFNTVHYVDLKVTSMKTININIRDSQGELIHFSDKFGKVVVKLHFRLK